MCMSALLRADGVAVNGGSRELKGDPQRGVGRGEVGRERNLIYRRLRSVIGL